MNDQWDTASTLYRWTYSVANSMLARGLTAPLQLDDLLLTPRYLRAHLVFDNLKGREGCRQFSCKVQTRQ